MCFRPPLHLQILGLLSLLALTGCASIFQGSSQNVKLHSDPDSARVTVDGFEMGSTPSTLHLDRGKSHLLTVRKSGYEEQTLLVNGSVHAGWVVLDILGGIIAIAIDAATGNWKSFEGEIHASLESMAPSDADTGSVAMVSSRQQPAGARAAPKQADESLPDGSPAILQNHLEVTCRAHRGSAWVDDTEVEFQFARGVTVSRKQGGKFREEKIKARPGESFFVIDGTSMYRFRVVQIRSHDIEVQWWGLT